MVAWPGLVPEVFCPLHSTHCTLKHTTHYSSLYSTVHTTHYRNQYSTPTSSLTSRQCTVGYVTSMKLRLLNITYLRFMPPFYVYINKNKKIKRNSFGKFWLVKNLTKNVILPSNYYYLFFCKSLQHVL